MTKQNPDILCKKCKEFEQSFENGMARCDLLVSCDHDEDESIKVFFLKDYELNMESTHYPQG